MPMKELNYYFKIADRINVKVSNLLVARFGLKKKMTRTADNHFNIGEDHVTNEMYEKFLIDFRREIR